MALHKVASRYAKSLLDLAKEQGNVAGVYEDIKTFMQAAQNREFYLFLKSPVIKADKKEKIFQELFQGKIQDLTFKFMQLLIQKGRESLLPSIGTAFVDLYQHLHKIRPATLYAVELMNDDQLAHLQSSFQSWLEPGEKMEIQQKSRPDLIGGFILEMGNQLYDGSVKRQLEIMKTSLYDKSYINLVEKK